MLVTDILRLSTRMFRTNRSRTFLTILGISVGIGTILFLVSLGYGIQQFILDRITTSDALLSLDISTGDLENIKLSDDSLLDIKGMIGVDKVSPLVTTQAQVSIDDISTELTANFADRDYFRLDGTIIKKGEFYEDEDVDNKKIILSSSALQLFNVSDEEIFNKKLNFVFFIDEDDNDKGSIARSFIEAEGGFTVVGIIEEENSNYAFLPRSLGQELGFNKYSKIKVKVESEESLNITREAIIERGYIVSALSDIIEQANQVFKIVQIVLASFGVIALIVSAIGMFNTMTIALLERTQEIGVMKALGATSLDVWTLFLAESVIIGFIGGLGGIFIGMSGGEVFNYAINILASAMGGEKVDLFATPWWFVFTIISFSTIVGLITGFYPARRAAKISAMEAVRYK
ncbi:MAG: ABC transporter permease [Elusimicrobiales bacterium]|nr:ABC transporter permease [Elusimicrobiales bacterium]